MISPPSLREKGVGGLGLCGILGKKFCVQLLNSSKKLTIKLHLHIFKKLYLTPKKLSGSIECQTLDLNILKML